MLLILGDTHGTDSPRLTPHLEGQLEAADVVMHTGDFTTETVYEAFHERCDRLIAVRGNNEEPALADRLPPKQVTDQLGLRFVIVHGHEHTELELSLLARQEGADVVVVGHSHRPTSTELDGVTIVNPGSHADPRRWQSAYAMFERLEDGIRGRLRGTDGTSFESIELEGRRN